MSKIGIMGGTFNPVHKGHIEMAKHAAQQFNLDKVVFITGGNPPHKRGNRILPGIIRHKMVQLAIKDYPMFFASDYEINKNTYSYTYETLEYMKRTHKEDSLYFIIGADSLHDLPTWKKPRLIMELCTFLVYSRKGYSQKEDLKNLKKEYYCKALFIDAKNVDVSSTRVRKKLEENQDVSAYLDKEVYDYIKRNNLYKKEEGSIKKRLKNRLSYDRFIHSCGVANTSIEMAKIFGADENKAYLAGMLHDCAKCIQKDKALRMCEDFGVLLDEFELKNPALVHAKLGEMVAMIDFGVDDKEVLEAIKYHTIGDTTMGDLAKIVYVADMIEPNRSFEGVEKLREIAKKDLDRAVAECTKMTVEFNEQKGKKVHPKAYEIIKYYDDK